LNFAWSILGCDFVQENPGGSRGVQTAYREGFRKSTREVAGERQAIGRKTLDDHWPS
jgi:hypothetical protein